MDEAKYGLRYLPIFYDDLSEVVSYIAQKLGNPKAAHDLLDKVEKAILERQPIAESFEPYKSAKERKYKYYRIYVGNFVIYYVVINDDPAKPIMEVCRFLYKGREKRDFL